MKEIKPTVGKNMKHTCSHQYYLWKKLPTFRTKKRVFLRCTIEEYKLLIIEHVSQVPCTHPVWAACANLCVITGIYLRAELRFVFDFGLRSHRERNLWSKDRWRYVSLVGPDTYLILKRRILLYISHNALKMAAITKNGSPAAIFNLTYESERKINQTETMPAGVLLDEESTIWQKEIS